MHSLWGDQCKEVMGSEVAMHSLQGDQREENLSKHC